MRYMRHLVRACSGTAQTFEEIIYSHRPASICFSPHDTPAYGIIVITKRNIGCFTQ